MRWIRKRGKNLCSPFLFFLSNVYFVQLAQNTKHVETEHQSGDEVEREGPGEEKDKPSLQEELYLLGH